ncbi:hypothetical protein BSLG_009761 [Batrachochytrium salamandrivorans]|nr:hypothetical protein BSLG_009761 [Batrachochytrium salamandrivorans]
MATNAHSPVSDLSPSGRRTKGQEWPSTRIRPSSLQASRGTESPMDFEMASDLAPDERSPWLLAVAMLTTPTKKKQLNQSPFQSPLPPSHSALSTSKKCDPMILDNRDIKPRGRKRKDGRTPLSNENSVDNHSEYNSKSISPVRGPSYHYMHLPYLITGYIQVAFTFFIVCIVAYILVQLIASVRHDLQMKADEFSQEMTQQIAMCTKSYYENRCMPGQRVPAVYKVCNEWEACMSRDPRDVGRLKVGAETLAEILNKLVDPLSYKTMFRLQFCKTPLCRPSATEIHHHHHPIQHQYTPPGHKTNAYSMALATNDSTNYLGMDQLRLRSGSTSRRHDRII